MEKPPYVGPRPFGPEDQAIFFGRGSEADQLVALIQARALTLLYAPSGAGKTSLLNAQVVPGLIGCGCHVLPVGRVGGDSAKGELAGDNPFVRNLLASMEAHPGENPSLTAELTARMPSQAADPTLTVLIIDQFEELFTHYPEAWSLRQALVSELLEAAEKLRGLRIVFSLKEEFLAGLEGLLKDLVASAYSKIRLELMTPQQALEAVEAPAASVGVPFAPGVAQLLVESLRTTELEGGSRSTSQHIEPIHIQLVCMRVWQSLADGQAVINAEDIRRFGNVDQVLQGFFDEAMRRIEPQPSEQATLREWINTQLILPDRSRALVNPRSFTGSYADRYRRWLERLVEEKIARLEVRDGTFWYELAHDRLIGPIRKSNASWDPERRTPLGLLRAAATRFAVHGSTHLLLSRDQLRDARAVLAKSGYREGLDERIDAFLHASQASVDEDERRIRGKNVILANMTGLALVMMVLVGVLAYKLDRDKVDLELRKNAFALAHDARSHASEGRFVHAVNAGLQSLRLAWRSNGTTEEDDAIAALKMVRDRVGEGVWLQGGDAGPLVTAAVGADGRWALLGHARAVLVHDPVRASVVARVDAPEPSATLLDAALLGRGDVLKVIWSGADPVSGPLEQVRVLEAGPDRVELRPLAWWEAWKAVSATGSQGDRPPQILLSGERALVWDETGRTQTVDLRSGTPLVAAVDTRGFDIDAGRIRLESGGTFLVKIAGDGWEARVHDPATDNPLVTGGLGVPRRLRVHAQGSGEARPSWELPGRFVFSSTGRFAAFLRFAPRVATGDARVATFMDPSVDIRWPTAYDGYGARIDHVVMWELSPPEAAPAHGRHAIRRGDIAITRSIEVMGFVRHADGSEVLVGLPPRGSTRGLLAIGWKGGALQASSDDPPGGTIRDAWFFPRDNPEAVAVWTRNDQRDVLAVRGPAPRNLDLQAATTSQWLPSPASHWILMREPGIATAVPVSSASQSSGPSVHAKKQFVGSVCRAAAAVLESDVRAFCKEVERS